MRSKISPNISREYDKMFCIEPEGERKITVVPCYKLIIDENQPFRLYTEEQLNDLAGRIKRSGLLNPIIARPADKGMYEVLSGRNRVKAVMLNGNEEIETIIRDVDDDTAAIIMIDANLGQRETLYPSEKAKAYKLEADVLNRRGKRPDSSFSNDCENFDAHQIIGERHNESKRTITYYIRLTHLIPELLELVDEKKLQFTAGVELSYLDAESQKLLLDKYIGKGVKLSKEQISKLKTLAKDGGLNEQTMAELLEKKKEAKPTGKKFKLSFERFSVFSGIPDNEKEFEDFVFNLIAAYQSRQTQ
jgi:ParB family chromosome partitioning protein